MQGDFPAPSPEFLKINLLKISELLDIETKTRSDGMLFDPECAVRFYDERLPQSICSAAELRNWVKEADQSEVSTLIMRDDDLPPAENMDHDFPDCIILKGTHFKLTYCYDQGAENDGITCEVALSQLPLAAQWPAEWLVPGALDEKLRWMIHVLPSKYRRLLQPVDETIAICRSYMKVGHGSLAEAFADSIYQARSVRVPTEIWLRDDWPSHLRVRFLIFDDEGKVLDASRDISDLLKRFSSAVKKPLEPSAVDQQWSREGVTSWDFGVLPEQVNIGKSGWPLINYPALVDNHESVAIQLFADQSAALAAHQTGLCRLFAIAMGKSCKRYFQPPSLPQSVALYLTQLEITSKQLGSEIGRAAMRESFTEGLPAIRSKDSFEERFESCYGRLHANHTERSRLVVAVLQSAAELEEILSSSHLDRETQDDLMEQLAWLVFSGFAESVPGSVLEHYPRYLECCRIRIQRAQANPDAGLRKLDELLPHWHLYTQFFAKEHPPHHDKQLLDQYRWLIEEYRVSLFAQELKTAQPVSSKRLRKLWERVVAEG